MSDSRRHFLKTGLALSMASGSAFLLGSGAVIGAEPAQYTDLKDLKSMSNRAQKIQPGERSARRTKLAQTMKFEGHAAVMIEPGSSLEYFTGVQWWISERLTAAIITAEGDTMFITPSFEESRLRELLDMPATIITWEEDENPFALIAFWLKKNNLHKQTLALDEAVRHFVAHRIQQASPKLAITSARNEINACRMIKSSTEIALMQLASDITITAYRTVFPLIDRGMTRADIIQLMYQTQVKLGADKPGGGAQIGKGSALPHGSKETEYVEDGAMVLMDFGCTVNGYCSDISRTFVYGEADKSQRQLWKHVHEGQAIAFNAAQPGTPAGTVDKKVRRFYEGLGYGPGYRLPGLSHRTGHGIGMDIHEPINFVSNEQTALQKGMCLSNEPGLYIPGRYGVRLEDCLYITDNGPRWFSTPPASIDEPIT